MKKYTISGPVLTAARDLLGGDKVALADSSSPGVTWWTVRGSQPYSVTLDRDFTWSRCTCPAGRHDRVCKHVVACLLAIETGAVIVPDPVPPPPVPPPPVPPPPVPPPPEEVAEFLNWLTFVR